MASDLGEPGTSMLHHMIVILDIVTADPLWATYFPEVHLKIVSSSVLASSAPVRLEAGKNGAALL